MSDQDTKTRFETTSKDCYDAYVAWIANQKDNDARTDLNEKIHELRKVVSRLEIEVAVSERGNNRQKPIAAPKHRNAGRAQAPRDAGNSDEASVDVKKGMKRSPRRKTSAAPKAEEG